MDGVVNSGICTGGWGAHGSTSELVPEGVSKLYHIVPHHDFESTKDSVDWEIKLSCIGSEIVTNPVEGVWSMDVCVHTCCVRCEEAGVGWKAGKGIKCFFQIE